MNSQENAIFELRQFIEEHLREFSIWFTEQKDIVASKYSTITGKDLEESQLSDPFATFHIYRSQVQTIVPGNAYVQKLETEVELAQEEIEVLKQELSAL